MTKDPEYLKYLMLGKDPGDSERGQQELGRFLEESWPGISNRAISKGMIPSEVAIMLLRRYKSLEGQGK